MRNGSAARSIRRRIYRLVAAAIVGGSLLAACGGGASSSATSSTTSTTSAAQSGFKGHWVYTATASDKTTESSLTTITGSPRRGSSKTGCKFGTSAAMIPATIAITNTTKGAAALVGVSINAGANLANWGWEVDLRTIAECGKPTTKKGGAGPLLILSGSKVAPGSTVAANVYFVVGDYYTSSNPTGNTSLLESPLVIAGKWATPTKAVAADVLTGPGALHVTSGSLAKSWVFSLSGKTPATS